MRTRVHNVDRVKSVTALVLCLSLLALNPASAAARSTCSVVEPSETCCCAGAEDGEKAAPVTERGSCPADATAKTSRPATASCDSSESVSGTVCASSPACACSDDTGPSGDSRAVLPCADPLPGAGFHFHAGMPAGDITDRPGGETACRTAPPPIGGRAKPLYALTSSLLC